MIIVRVTLHNETNYQPLHDAMARRGFNKLLTSDAGTTYRLPDGTYVSTTIATAEAAHDAALFAARSVGHLKPQIVAAEAGPISFSGLEIASGAEILRAAAGF